MVYVDSLIYVLTLDVSFPNFSYQETAQSPLANPTRSNPECKNHFNKCYRMGQILSSIFSDDHKIPDNNNHGYYHEYEEKAEAYYIFSNIIQPPASQSTRSTRRNGITRGNYNRYQRILVVGDGDFSFSASLAMALGSASNMVATSLDSLGICLAFSSFSL